MTAAMTLALQLALVVLALSSPAGALLAPGRLARTGIGRRFAAAGQRLVVCPGRGPAPSGVFIGTVSEVRSERDLADASRFFVDAFWGEPGAKGRGGRTKGKGKEHLLEGKKAVQSGLAEK